MRHLLDFIVESSIRNIFEAFDTYYDSADSCIDFYNQNDDNYNLFAKYGINDIIIKQLYEIMKDSGYKQEIPFTIDINKKEIKISRYFKDNADQLSDLAKITKDRKYFIFNNASNKIKIGDGIFSKGSTSGRQTEEQELLLCDLINSGGDENIVPLKIDEYGLSKDYEFSVKAQYKKLLEFLETNNITEYIAFRPTNAKGSKNTYIKNIINLLNDIYSKKELFNGAPTSYITPADIYVVKTKDSNIDLENELEEIINSYNTFGNVKSKFLELLNNKSLIPISLKKIIESKPNNKVEELNISNENRDIFDFNEINKIRINPKGVLLEFKKLNDPTTIVTFQYKSNDGSIKPLTFEFKNNKSGGQDGKFKEFVKNLIKNGYFNKILNKKDYQEVFYEYFPRPAEFFEIIKNNDIFSSEIKFKNYFNTTITNFEKTFNTCKEFKYNISEKDVIDIYNNANPNSEENGDKKDLYILYSYLKFIEILISLYNQKDNQFKNFIIDCYFSSKKITSYSLPYILIK